MPDIFDIIDIKERKRDIFDLIRIDKRIIKELTKSVSDSLSANVTTDIFDRIKIELPGLLKKFVPPERNEIEITNELINAIRAEVIREMKVFPVPKPVQKVIEKTVIEKHETKIENPIDVEALKAEFDKKLEEAVKKAKKEAEDNYRVVIAPSQLPNLEHNVGKFLTIENSVDGLRTKWTDTFSTVPIVFLDGIILRNSAGVYYKLGVDLDGAPTTTEVTP